MGRNVPPTGTPRDTNYLCEGILATTPIPIPFPIPIPLSHMDGRAIKFANSFVELRDWDGKKCQHLGAIKMKNVSWGKNISLDEVLLAA